MAKLSWPLLLSLTFLSSLSLESSAEDKDFYCYHCVSPFKNLRNAELKDELRRFFRNTLERLSAVESLDCGFTRNVSRLARQKCEDVNTCIEVKAEDYTIGRPYYIRACAEELHPKWYVKQRKNEECPKSPKGLAIRECFCSGSLCNSPNSGLVINSSQWLTAAVLFLWTLLWER